MDRLNESARSVEYQEQVVKTLYSKMSNNDYKAFVKALIDELYLGNDINNRVNFLDDLVDCIKVTISGDVQDYCNLDTVVREHFMDAYDKSQSNAVIKDSKNVVVQILNGVPVRNALCDDISPEVKAHRLTAKVNYDLALDMLKNLSVGKKIAVR